MSKKKAGRHAFQADEITGQIKPYFIEAAENRSKKNPSGKAWVLGLSAWRFPTFARQPVALSSALSGFTSEFGMGSGGSRSLWSPSKGVRLVFGPGGLANLGRRKSSCLEICNVRFSRIQASAVARFSSELHPNRLGVIWSSLTGN
jgi:hypothetical protein